MTKNEALFADALVTIGAIQFGAFTLSSRITSPIYIDLSIIRSFPDLLNAGSDLLWMLTKQLPDFDAIADVPTGATPIVSAIVSKYGIPMITPRIDKVRSHEAPIDGVFLEGQRIVVIDDVVTTAGSMLVSISALEYRKLRVEHACTLVDREQGGREALKLAGYQLHTVFSLRKLLNRYRNTEAISRKQYSIIMHYLDNS